VGAVHPDQPFLAVFAAPTGSARNSARASGAALPGPCCAPSPCAALPRHRLWMPATTSRPVKAGSGRASPGQHGGSLRPRSAGEAAAVSAQVPGTRHWGGSVLSGRGPRVLFVPPLLAVVARAPRTAAAR
jgi:hypothetical protein